jgi:uncharacterized membrane protein
VIATLLHVVPIMAVVVPAYIFFYVTMLVSVAAQGGDEPNPAAMLGVLAVFSLFWLVVVVLIIVISIGFTFVYPLIVDRKLQGFDAVKLSFKAAMPNFFRLFLMQLLTGLLSLVGILFCYVGVFFVFPIAYGAIASAYEQVFGLANPNENYSDLPPPPPVFT